MKPVVRGRVSKDASARKFKHNVSKTKSMNVGPGPMRGGIRL
ncbi:MAG: hypothetical protein [Microvirus sp.]|nr:MAG: hypothetical protein [Microvirus sp.]